MNHKTRLLWWGLILFTIGITISYLQTSVLVYNSGTTGQSLVEIIWFVVGLIASIGGLYNINQSLEK